ncbi:hypothetical protein L6164_005304 [Bauhinia variegata]|uniref:Uncharacterized protein n=1 Tax=Bauhinia variegata TaxID=167791 RepID=A0ACB9PSS5_BAUVA|nr:hypothetical protein L6164_005304 [Bauhinia variegata]
MSPAQFHSKREIAHSSDHNNNSNHIASLCPPSLKINKESHFIKKSPSSSSSSSSSSTSSSLVNGVKGAVAAKPQQQRPVIIYTHSPKIIHTNPKDFMALVQKLTGLSRPEEDGRNAPRTQPKQEPGSGDKEDSNDHKNKIVSNEDNETTSSVVTDDNNSASCNVGDSQVSSCFVAPRILEPPLNPYVGNLPVFTPNPADFLCSNQPFLNYTDSLFFPHHNMMSSITSSATLEGVNELREY